MEFINKRNAQDGAHEPAYDGEPVIDDPAAFKAAFLARFGGGGKG